jgi:hypothetical protein
VRESQSRSSFASFSVAEGNRRETGRRGFGPTGQLLPAFPQAIRCFEHEDDTMRTALQVASTPALASR